MIDFKKIHAGPVDREFVLKKVSDAQIFYYYFGPFEVGKVYGSVFRRDRMPSTGFYINRKGLLVYHDFKTGEKWDTFAFVAEKHRISYGEAIKKIAADFGLIDPQTRVVSEADISGSVDFDRDFKRKTLIQFQPCPWSDRHLTYWRQYECNQAELEREHIYPVGSLYINKKKIYNPNNHIRFAYLEKYQGEEYVKIYSPEDKQMKWVSNFPLNVPFGYETLNRNSDTVIVTKSKKDIVVLKRLFPSVMATQNESQSALPDNIVEDLVASFQRRIIFWDNDETGVENCKKFNDRGFGYFNIPKYYYDKFRIKDASDYVSYYGTDALAELMQQKSIL